MELIWNTGKLFVACFVRGRCFVDHHELCNSLMSIWCFRVLNLKIYIMVSYGLLSLPIFILILLLLIKCILKCQHFFQEHPEPLKYYSILAILVWVVGLKSGGFFFLHQFETVVLVQATSSYQMKLHCLEIEHFI